MLIWLNGPFGGGKTQTAYELRRRLADAVVCDPELVGFGLQHTIPRGLRPDFQTLASWRAGVVEVLDHTLRHRDGPVIAPMTLVEPAYFEEIIGGLRELGPRRAPLRARGARRRRTATAAGAHARRTPPGRRAGGPSTRSTAASTPSRDRSSPRTSTRRSTPSARSPTSWRPAATCRSRPTPTVRCGAGYAGRASTSGMSGWADSQARSVGSQGAYCEVHRGRRPAVRRGHRRARRVRAAGRGQRRRRAGRRPALRRDPADPDRAPARRRPAAGAGDPAQQGGRDRQELRRPRRRDGRRGARGAVDVPQAQHRRGRPGRPDLLPAAVGARRLRGRARRGDRPDLPRRAAGAGHRRHPRLHDRQRRDRPRPAEEGRPVDAGPRASTPSARSARGSRPTSTRSTSPTACRCRPTSTATWCRTARPRT